jgi:HEAT repeat protein
VNELLASTHLKNLKDSYFDVRAASAIALGKLSMNTPQIRAGLLKGLKDKNLDVQEASALALGMIRAVESSPVLSRLVANKREDRKLRCFAAVALGLMRDTSSIRLLQNVFWAADSKAEVKAGCLIGLGLLKDERAATTLFPVVNGTFKEDLQAFAVTSLAKIGTTEITIGRGRRARTVDLVDFFEKKLLDKTTKTQVRRALAMALGTMGRESSTIQALQRAYKIDRDRGVQSFALVSLAQLKKEESNKIVVREILRRALMNEKNGVVRGFAALAVGLTGDAEGGQLLLRVFKEDGDPEVRAAATIGLGIIKYIPALPDLGHEVNKPRGIGDARGYACIAMGMIGHPSAAETLRTTLRDVNIPYLKAMASMGLALLSDRAGLSLVVDHIDDKNRITREAAVRSLAHFREDSTVQPLIKQLKKEKSNEVRAMIVVTLGVIGDASKGVPVLRKIGQNVNWIAARRMPAVDLLTKLF